MYQLQYISEVSLRGRVQRLTPAQPDPQEPPHSPYCPSTILARPDHPVYIPQQFAPDNEPIGKGLPSHIEDFRPHARFLRCLSGRRGHIIAKGLFDYVLSDASVILDRQLEVNSDETALPSLQLRPNQAVGPVSTSVRPLAGQKGGGDSPSALRPQPVRHGM